MSLSAMSASKLPAKALQQRLRVWMRLAEARECDWPVLDPSLLQFNAEGLHAA
jgi:hypothetical protein